MRVTGRDTEDEPNLEVVAQVLKRPAVCSHLEIFVKFIMVIELSGVQIDLK